jgi:ribose transport system substrate-binding protein
MFAAIVVALGAAMPAQAQVTGDAKAGEGKIAMCIGCHGIIGYKSSFPEVYHVPKISGQNAKYIAAVLEAYKKGDRKHPSMRGIATTLDNERWDAFTGVLKNSPDIKILDAKYANWNRDDAFKVMQDYLTRFKQIDAVWAADDDMAVGVLKAIDQSKRTDIKIVFGGAGAKGMIKTLMDGKDPRIVANVSYSPKFMYDSIKLTAEARLKGEKLPATYIIPSVLITKENAADFYFPDSPF